MSPRNSAGQAAKEGNRKEQGLANFSLVSISVVKDSFTAAINEKKNSRKGAETQRKRLFFSTVNS
jgi:hypothetical protein